MKATELIAQLQQLVAEHGDLAVLHYNEDNRAYETVDAVRHETLYEHCIGLTPYPDDLGDLGQPVDGFTLQ